MAKEQKLNKIIYTEGGIVKEINFDDPLVINGKTTDIEAIPQSIAIGGQEDGHEGGLEGGPKGGPKGGAKMRSKKGMKKSRKGGKRKLRKSRKNKM